MEADWFVDVLSSAAHSEASVWLRSIFRMASLQFAASTLRMYMFSMVPPLRVEVLRLKMLRISPELILQFSI